MTQRMRLTESMQDMVKWRRHLHRNPELSFTEQKTSQYIADLLRGFGIEPRTQVGGHGVIGEVRGQREGSRTVVALRADIDALPIQDEKQCEYSSQVPGVMHACGHDAHTSALLATARWFKQRQDRFAGMVRFLFQPAEEVSPGGAKPMIQDGALDDVDYVYGVHLWTPMEAGHVHCIDGPFMAAADEFRVTIQGKGGHGGLPHETVDSIVIASQFVTSLQSIVSRSINPIEPCVVSVGSIRGGTGFNIIAESCEIIGTVRSFSEPVRTRIKERLQELAEGICSMHGAEAKFEYKQGYPPVINDAGEYSRFTRVATSLFGPEKVHRSNLIMAGEDFSYYLQKVPGCFMFVGAGDLSNHINYPHHHPRFDIVESSMMTSARLLTAMALDALGASDQLSTL
jgi:amidohydrolase